MKIKLKLLRGEIIPVSLPRIMACNFVNKIKSEENRKILTVWEISMNAIIFSILEFLMVSKKKRKSVTLHVQINFTWDF